MTKWINKFLQFRLKDEHAHPDSLVFNLLNLAFWAIFLAVIIFLFTIIA